MTRPHGLLRAGYPYSTTLGMRRVTNFPTDIAFGEDNVLYVLLRSEGVATIRIWYRDDMEELTGELKGFGSFGSEDGQLRWPVNIITDDSGNIYVSDEANHRITKFDPDGGFISKFGRYGQGKGEFDGPSGFALDNNGHFIICDSKNSRIQRYTKDGEYIDSFGSYGSEPGQFNLPWGVDCDENGDIYVSDWGNHRIQIFSPDGKLKKVVGEFGSGDGQFNRPTGITVDNHGDFYVADWGNNRVLMYNSEGQYIWSFYGDATLSKVARNYMLTNAVPNRLREMGKLESEKFLRRPRSVRIDDDFRLYIPDFESYRIQVYQKDFIELDQTQYAGPLRNPTLEVT
ncbi:MAG: NHL repeat-containing protein [SAR202 cluster bacterium]|nr:NHL repeat-containing protein [SAR202 cluster bacterium]